MFILYKTFLRLLRRYASRNDVLYRYFATTKGQPHGKSHKLRHCESSTNSWQSVIDILSCN